jgi:iron complex transport system ATP-binding protein
VTKLTNYEEREVDTLSGGQRQRVWIAMALAQQTDLILLDEPTTYLDMSHQMEVLELLYELNRTQGCSIVMVLHDLNLAARFSDIMIAMREGKIIKQGSPKEVMSIEVLKEAFHVEAQIVEDKKSNRPICLTYDLIKV